MRGSGTATQNVPKAVSYFSRLIDTHTHTYTRTQTQCNALQCNSTHWQQQHWHIIIAHQEFKDAEVRSAASAAAHSSNTFTLDVCVRASERHCLPVFCVKRVESLLLLQLI